MQEILRYAYDIESFTRGTIKRYFTCLEAVNLRVNIHCAIKLKGALDNILKFYFWLNFIYHVKCKVLLIYEYKKKNSKIPSEN